MKGGDPAGLKNMLAIPRCLHLVQDMLPQGTLTLLGPLFNIRVAYVWVI